MRQIENTARLDRDLAIRAAVNRGQPVVEIPNGGFDFWHWYKGWVNPLASIRFIEVDCPDYPPADKPVALWYSGGCESTYSRHLLRDEEQIELLSIGDFHLFETEHRRIGQIHFLCAAIGAALGYRRTIVGVERNDLLLSRILVGDRYVGGSKVERSPEFLDRWSSYLRDRSLESVCRDSTKEEIYRFLHENHIEISGTCDNDKTGRWCARCFKCYEAYYTAKALGIRPPTRLAPKAFDRFYGEYQSFIDSRFRDNVNNAQQYFLRLELLYAVTFDRAEDCDPERDGELLLAPVH